MKRQTADSNVQHLHIAELITQDRIRLPMQKASEIEPLAVAAYMDAGLSCARRIYRTLTNEIDRHRIFLDRGESAQSGRINPLARPTEPKGLSCE